jgi:hypothetical protein
MNSFDEKFTLLCVTEKSNGFDWKDKDWFHTKFKGGGRYIIKKLDYGDESYGCSINKKGDEKYGDTLLFKDSCYGFKKFGVEEKASPNTCRELWNIDKDNDALTINRIMCDTISHGDWRLKPNGWFHRAVINEHLIKTVKKDSMYIDIGKCSTL